MTVQGHKGELKKATKQLERDSSNFNCQTLQLSSDPDYNFLGDCKDFKSCS